MAEANINAMSPRRGGERLIEVRSRHLKCLGALTGKNFAKAEALPLRALEKQRRILDLVSPGDHRWQKTCFVENVVAAGQQRFADLKSREGGRF